MRLRLNGVVVVVEVLKRGSRGLALRLRASNAVEAVYDQSCVKAQVVNSIRGVNACGYGCGFGLRGSFNGVVLRTRIEMANVGFHG
jgi:hypothetical protein